MDFLMSAHCLLSLTWPQKSLETPLETSLETPQENILNLLGSFEFGMFGYVGFSFGRAY